MLEGRAHGEWAAQALEVHTIAATEVDARNTSTGLDTELLHMGHNLPLGKDTGHLRVVGGCGNYGARESDNCVREIGGGYGESGSCGGYDARGGDGCDDEVHC